MFQQLLQEDFRMLQVVSTGAYYPPVDTTWKILTTGASQLTAGALCNAMVLMDHSPLNFHNFDRPLS